ncbi:hypothetical protein PILCRDRAFT_671852 [Piloderma croceum F 1598]|uniref:Uncharacterized protein n=1 Tax=Piloderma croceum (strain F 1598) TaxID=765440 RepID=A0A0C3ESC5_PILCF|nr:hypothetical protein PILCRDRAFT_671852 [Piloderma croceum F 1598]
MDRSASSDFNRLEVVRSATGCGRPRRGRLLTANSWQYWMWRTRTGFWYCIRDFLFKLMSCSQGQHHPKLDPELFSDGETARLSSSYRILTEYGGGVAEICSVASHP